MKEDGRGRFGIVWLVWLAICISAALAAPLHTPLITFFIREKRGIEAAGQAHLNDYSLHLL